MHQGEPSQAGDVTVIMPVWNGAATVLAAVHSVLSQDRPELHLLVVDDGSTDDTAALLETVQDSRLRVVRQPHNTGLVAALNRGLAEARTPFVARLDADDLAHPTRLSTQRQRMIAEHLTLCATGYRRVTPDGQTLAIRRPPVDHASMVIALLAGNRICHSSVMMRTDAALAVGGYDPAWFPVEDYDLWLRLVRIGRYGGVDQALVDYCENPEGISQQRATEQRQREQARARQYEEDAISSLEPSRRRRQAESPVRRRAAAIKALLRESDAQHASFDHSSVADAVVQSLIAASPHGPVVRRHIRVATAAPAHYSRWLRRRFSRRPG